MTDAGLKSIAQCKKLSVLNLFGTQRDGRGTKELSKLDHLRSLTISAQRSPTRD